MICNHVDDFDIIISDLKGSYGRVEFETIRERSEFERISG